MPLNILGMYYTDSNAETVIHMSLYFQMYSPKMFGLLRY